MVYTAHVQKTPLLPFEKQLIDLLGCTEDEYRFFTEEARKRALIRPAEYDLIPDVQNTGAEVIAIVSLVIGLAGTAASFLLAPKPKAPILASNTTAAADIQRRELASIVGPNRFNSTFGFDGQTQLANYQDPIPVVFGRYTGTTGGILVAPSLVWSRMFSYGNQQGVKLLFVVGEQGENAGQVPQGIEPPDLNGIFWGNGPFDAVYASSFAFYWKRNTGLGVTRVGAGNLLYGTRGTTASGDPETHYDIFSVPTAISDNDTGFCSSHALNNNFTFGCYAPIANGTPYRVNWQIISILNLPDQDDDPGSNLTARRVKISGDNNGLAKTGDEVRALGQFGIGRNYSRRMGITRLNGTQVFPNEGSAERSIQVNDVIDFTISSARIPDDFYAWGNVTVDDINNYIEQECIKADDALVVGELFMIGRSVWQVVSRSLNRWIPGGTEDQVVKLRCIELTIPLADRNKVGVVSDAVLDETYVGDSGDTAGDAGPLFVGIAYYPLMKFSFATVKNTRPCEVTEIGIKSNVYQRLNGLANFQEIPAPQQLIDLDQRRVSLTLGSNTSFIKRASVFVIQLRPAGVDSNGNSYPWAQLGLRFAIVGSQPVDVYNFIRIKSPVRGQYEYRFVPKNGSDMRLTPDDSIIWQLNATGNQNESLVENISTDYGVFQVRSVGSVVRKRDLQQNKEFTIEPNYTPAVITQTAPSAIGVYSFLPELADSGAATQVLYKNTVSDPAGFTTGRGLALGHELLGDADTSGHPLFSNIYITQEQRLQDGRWIKIQFALQRAPLPQGHYSGKSYGWFFTTQSGWLLTTENLRVEASSTGWRAGQEFVFLRQIGPTNPFRVVPNQGTMIDVGFTFQVTAVDTFVGGKGRAQGWYYELFGRAQSLWPGYYKSVEANYVVGGKKIRVNYVSTVITLPYAHSSGETLFWDNPTIVVNRDASATSGDWNVGDRFPVQLQVSQANPFLNYLATPFVGALLQILAVTNREILPQFTNSTRTFEAQSQYADLSFYGDLVEKSNANNPEHSVTYVNEIVSNESLPEYDNLTVCGVALKAGRNFGSLDQLRVWLANGLHVYRFHPNYANSRYGPSNHFTDLVYYFLTSNVGGLGATLRMNAVSPNQINTQDFELATKFIETNKLYYDGVIGSVRNIRQFISETAPFFLCNFVISDGQFGLRPAVPTTVGGAISTNPIPIKQIFTAGNIIENSFEVQFLDSEERKDFVAVMRYREGQRNQLPQERNITIRWRGTPETAPLESFDMTEYCTSEAHARLVGKFFLSVRRRVTHTVSFTTSPYGMDLAPGDYIKVVTEASPYTAARNGVIDSQGVITSAQAIINGQYNIVYYKVGSTDVDSAVMTVNGGRVNETALYDSVFTIQEVTSSCNIYMIEQLTVNEDFLATITASEFPCDDRGASLIAQDILSDNNFTFQS